MDNKGLLGCEDMTVPGYLLSAGISGGWFGKHSSLIPALPTQVGTHGGWLIQLPAAMDPGFRQESGKTFNRHPHPASSSTAKRSENPSPTLPT